MSRLSRALGALAIVSSLSALGTAELRPKEPVPTDPKLEFTKYTLPNGLEVILSADRSVPVVAVNVWYHVGSGNETYGKSGFAHLFEHMLFQGSKHVGVDNHFEILKTAGSDLVNGTTNSDRTNYFEVLPSNQLETGLWLESDRMGYLLEAPKTVADSAGHFKTSLDNQIEVVRNERRQRYDNQPYGKALLATFAGLYPEGHPYRYLTIGKHEDLAGASTNDVIAFFKTWYVPANATLAIVGDIDIEETKKLVDKWFGKFPKSDKPRVVPAPVPPLQSKTVEVNDDQFAKLPQVRFVWHSPANFADDDAELDIAANALSREGAGRLYKALVLTGKAQSVQAYQSGAGFSGTFTVNVTLKGDSSLDDVRKIVLDEVTKVTKQPLDPREVNRVVVGNEAGAIRELETVMGRAENLQAYNHYLNNPDRLSWDLDRFRRTNPEKIRAACAKYLAPDRMLTVITTPVAKGAK